jgi:hypothetical protein
MYILHNQYGYFLTKSGTWSDGRELPPLFKTIHKDEAINQLFETNSRDYKLRLSLLECETNSKKMPLIPVEKLPPILQESIDASNLLKSESPVVTDQNSSLESH